MRLPGACAADAVNRRGVDDVSCGTAAVTNFISRCCNDGKGTLCGNSELLRKCVVGDDRSICLVIEAERYSRRSQRVADGTADRQTGLVDGYVLVRCGDCY